MRLRRRIQSEIIFTTKSTKHTKKNLGDQGFELFLRDLRVLRALRTDFVVRINPPFSVECPPRRVHHLAQRDVFLQRDPAAVLVLGRGGDELSLARSDLDADGAERRLDRRAARARAWCARRGGGGCRRWWSRGRGSPRRGGATRPATIAQSIHAGRDFFIWIGIAQASSAPAARSCSMVWPMTSAVVSSRLTSSTQAASASAAGAACPSISRRTFGWSGSSRAPAP